MKKRKKLIFITVLLFSVAAYFMLGWLGMGKQYIDKENKITASVVDINNIFSPQDSEDVFKVKVDEISEYFGDNNINTAIVPFNRGIVSAGEIEGCYNYFNESVFADGKDALQLVKKSLNDSKIQVILEIDCADLTAEMLRDTVKNINKKYAVAGILLKNYSHDYAYLQTIKMDINKQLHNYYFGIRLDSVAAAEQIVPFGAVDFYVFDNITETEYRQAKGQSLASESILLDHNSPDFISNLFILGNFSGYDGVILSEYTSPATDLSLYHNIMNTSDKLQRFEFTVNNEFGFIYPSKNIDTYYSTIYITGTANPSQYITVNGQKILTAKDGTFGCLIELAEGENLVEIQQGENYASRLVNKKSWSYTGTAEKKQSDDTQKAKKGQIVQTTQALTSVLRDADDDSRIIDGVQQGVQMKVQKSVKTERNGKYTWAYQLSNGAYVLAQNVEWVSKEEYIESVLTDIYLEKLDNGDEYINLNITGKPAIISYYSDIKVVFEILDAQLSEEFYGEDVLEHTVFLDSSFGNGCKIYAADGNVYIEFENSGEELWGYHIEYYESNKVKIYLKKAPHKISGAKPLTGVSVVVDAGHGGQDPGALPLGGVDGPGESDINLAIARATKTCLEKFGATVYFTRSDDTYLTLQERRDITNTIKPDLFISVHHNSLEYTVDGSQTMGVESYYFSPQSKSVAESMSDKIASATDRKNRGYFWGYYYVLRNDIAPCVLNEYAYLINPYEYSTLYSDESIYKAAMGTALAVLDIIPE